MACLCQLINAIKDQMVDYEKNSNASAWEKAVQFLLDKIYLGEYILPTIDAWLKNANEAIAANKANFLSDSWVAALLSNDLYGVNSIYEPYRKEADALRYLQQAIERLQADQPHNPFFDYDEMLAGITSRQAQIEAEKDMLYAMWAELHKNGVQPTRDQAVALIDAASKGYNNGYIDPNSISNLSDNLHFLVGLAVDVSKNPYFELASSFYDFFMKEHFFPTINNSVREALDIRLKNLSFLRFLRICTNACGCKKLERFRVY